MRSLVVGWLRSRFVGLRSRLGVTLRSLVVSLRTWLRVLDGLCSVIVVSVVVMVGAISGLGERFGVVDLGGFGASSFAFGFSGNWLSGFERKSNGSGGGGGRLGCLLFGHGCAGQR